MTRASTLDTLRPGQTGTVTALDTPIEQQRRLMALGFIPGAEIRAEQESPWGDPVAYRVCGAVIALRRADARRLRVDIAE